MSEGDKTEQIDLAGQVGVVATASSAGLGPNPYAAAYSTARCVVIRFTENLATETEVHGIRALAILPRALVPCAVA